jgi:hypothetical protein
MDDELKHLGVIGCYLHTSDDITRSAHTNDAFENRLYTLSVNACLCVSTVLILGINGNWFISPSSTANERTFRMMMTCLDLVD